MTRAVDLVWPHDIDDPSRPSGGNRYDRELASGLRALGWTVREHVAGDDARLAQSLDDMPDDALVVLDGLIGSAAASALESPASRLRLVLLVHLPAGSPSERQVADLVDHVVVTSEWSARWWRSRYGQMPVSVALPGTGAAPPTAPAADGHRLLCVGAVTAVKGQDLLVEALGLIGDLSWTCRLVGSEEIDSSFAAEVRRRAGKLGIADRITWTGPMSQGIYEDADLLVSASRFETYGMAITEAVAHGLPVIVTEVGGVREALGGTGVLVRAEDPEELAAALRVWLTDGDARTRLRAGVGERRHHLPTWEQTVAAVDTALSRLDERVRT